MAMKIAHLIDSGGLYGAEQVLLTLCQQQQAQGLQPLIVSCGLPGEAEKPLEHAAVERGIPVISWRMPAGIRLAGMRALREVLRQEKVQLLHSHGYKFNILLALLGRTRLGMPLVSTVHGYVKARFPHKMWLYEMLDRIALRRFDRVVLVSEQMRQLAAFRRNTPRICVINNGIAATEAQPSPVVINDRLELLAVGRLSPEKGFNVLIDAVAELNREQPVCKLTLMGSGGLDAALKAQAQALGQAEHIQFCGFVSNAAVHFHQYHLLVMPSLTEGIPVTLLEAMRNKTPVIASAVGGIPQVLGEQHPQLLQPGSASSIVEACKAWLRLSSEQRTQQVEQNFMRYQQNFTAHAMADKYLGLYQSLLTQGTTAYASRY